MAITRRDFIKGAVATGALAPTLLNLPFVDAAPTNEWAFENHIPSVCTLCPGGCGIKVRQFKKKAIRIYGNSMHPINLGGLCPRGVAGTQVLYNPDRIRYPMTQKKGSGKWEKISWDEAIKIVSEKLAGVRSKGEPHTLVAFAGQLNGLMRSLAEKFLKIYGSPNFIDVNPTTKPDNAIYLMQGIESAPAYDIAKSAYVLSLNGDFLDNGVSPVHMMKSYAEMRSRINKQRGKLVYAGPRLSITAAKADEWIPIKPGTEGALALGIAHSILKERLYAENFINSHTTGFADWVDETGKTHDGFRTVVFRDYSPIAVSDITGVPPEIIINMARELTRLKPAVVIGSSAFGFNYQSVYTRMAIHSLNALVGNIDTAGSVLIPRPFPSFPEEVELDQTAKNGLAMPSIKEDIRNKHPLCLDTSNFIPQRCLGGIPYKPSIILLFETNPVYDNIYA